MKFILIILGCTISAFVMAQKKGQAKQPDLTTKIAALASQYEAQVIGWRRHMHQYPELSNREYKTMAYIADNLKGLDVTIETGMAHTGVVAVLNTGKPGPVIGLRADMDGLPVYERVKLPHLHPKRSQIIWVRK